MKSQKKILKIYCLQCKGKTKHQRLFLHEVKISHEEEQLFAQYDYEVYSCNGCETVTFRISYTDSDSYHPESGEYYEDEKLYPIRTEDNLQLKNYFNAPNGIRNIYRETIESYNSELLRLSGAGVRAIIESICVDKGIKKGKVEKTKKDGTKKIENSTNLDGKIAGLAEAGILTVNHSEILHNHRYLGNDSVHTMESPSKIELRLAIEIIENTLELIYEMEDKAEMLKHKRKRRLRNLKLS